MTIAWIPWLSRNAAAGVNVTRRLPAAMAIGFYIRGVILLRFSAHSLEDVATRRVNAAAASLLGR